MRREGDGQIDEWAVLARTRVARRAGEKPGEQGLPGAGSDAGAWDECVL